MGRCAAQWALDGATVFKPAEIEAARAKRSETVQNLRNQAQEQRNAAEQAREMSREKIAQGNNAAAEQHEGFAKGHDMEAQVFEDQAELGLVFFESQMTTGDPRCATYRSCGPADPKARALGVKSLLKEKIAEIFGREYPKWAAVYASAATGGLVTRDQGWRRQTRRVR